MAAGVGYLDAEGVWIFGESDTDALFSDVLNLGQAETSAQFAVDRARLDTLENIVTPHTMVRRRSVALTNTFTNTNAAYTDLPQAADKAALDMTFVKEGAATKLVLHVSCQIELSSGAVGGQLQVGINIDGVDYDVALKYVQTTATRYNFSGIAEVTGLAAGSKAVKPRVRYLGVATSSVNLVAAGIDHIHYSVQETM